MCHQVVEVYSECKCLYYQHAVDKCTLFPNHKITIRIISVGDSCAQHSVEASHQGRNSFSCGSESRGTSQPIFLDSGRGAGSEGLLAQVEVIRKPLSAALAHKRREPLPGVDPNSTLWTSNVPNKANNKAIYAGTQANVAQRESGLSKDDVSELKTLPPSATDYPNGYPNRLDEGHGPHNEDSAKAFFDEKRHPLPPRGHDDRPRSTEPTQRHSRPDTLQDTPAAAGLELEQAFDSDSDSASVISQSSTVVDEDSVEILFNRLITFKSLRYLWPQVVALHGSRHHCLQTLSSLLKCFSEDLGQLATSVHLKDSESGICLSACRFVRKSRMKLAHGIWEAHGQAVHGHGMTDEDLGFDKRQPNSFASSKQTSYEHFEETVDPNFTYVVAERFLFDTAPVEALEASVQELVRTRMQRRRRSLPVYKFFETCFWSFISSVAVPPTQKGGTQRISWTCVSRGNVLQASAYPWTTRVSSYRYGIVSHENLDSFQHDYGQLPWVFG